MKSDLEFRMKVSGATLKGRVGTAGSG